MASKERFTPVIDGRLRWLDLGRGADDMYFKEFSNKSTYQGYSLQIAAAITF